MDQIVGRRPDPAEVGRAIEELAAAFGDRLVTSRVVREQHGNTTTWIASQPPDAVVYPQSTEDVQQVVRICAAAACRSFPFGAGTSFEGSVNAPLRRRLDRLPRHEPGAGRAPGRLRLRDRARHHPDAAQRAPAGPGPVLPRRSRCRCFPRRHGLDPRLRDDRGPLRHDEGQRAGVEGRAAERRADVHVAPGAKVLGRLRPDPARCRRRGHAGRHHRADVEAARHSRGDRRGRLPVPFDRGRVRRRDRRDPGRHSGRARRASGRGAGARLQCRRQAWASPRSRCCSSSFTAPRPAWRNSRSASARSRASSGAVLSNGRPRPRSGAACGGHATTSSGPTSRSGPVPMPS